MRWIRRAAQDQLQRPRARRMGLHLRGRRLSPVAQIVGVVAMTASAEPELRSEITCPHCGYREVEESRRTHASSSTNARDAVSCCVQRKATAACSALTVRCRARPSNLSVRVTVAAAATNFLNSLLEVQRRASETNPRAFGSQRAKHAPWLLLNGLCLFALSRYEPPHRGEIRVFSFALWILFLFRDLRALGRALPAFFCQLLTHLNPRLTTHWNDL